MKIKTSVSLSPELVARLSEGKLSTQINSALEDYIRIKDLMIQYINDDKLSGTQVLTSIETILKLDVKH